MTNARGIRRLVDFPEGELIPVGHRAPSAVLMDRLRAAGVELPGGAVLVRVYASAADRNVGAWSWTLHDADGRPLNIGSQFSVRELLRGPLEVSAPDRSGDRHIDPA